jgi:filamentous hemagglutinin family protein
MERTSLRLVERRWLWRAALLATTGLSTVLVGPVIVRAQTTLAPDATPQGGVVVGGNSTIMQTPGNTAINQASQRTAIDWQSFNVGSNATVRFNQPNASAIALNRVVGGDLSQINGRIDANGQIVLVNQSGVVFGNGSQVNAESVVVSTSNIAPGDFMSGRMNFTGAPNPGAKIINNGNITVRDTGLVGLVAPQVANNGLITARLGQVVLAGASAFTLDLYGDRLISLDVTSAVRAVDIGGKTLPALVTNSGIIIADGGHVTLTAQDADALVTQLINAGGTIRADSVGSRAGTISLQGVGGNINIAGNLLARGTTQGSKGGGIEALTTGTVALAPGAVVDASGDARGGLIAIGTNLARAAAGQADAGAPKAAAVSIAQGAALKADATGSGDGGTVTLLSKQRTDFAGSISVQGGPNGGNGGLAEISSDGVISLSGTVLATAVGGQAGEIMLDPQMLVVGSVSSTASSSSSGGTITIGTDSSVTSYIGTTALNALSGNIVLEATSLVSVASAVTLATSGTALSIVSQGNVSVSNFITVNGSLEIDAGNAINIVSGGLTASNILLNGTSGIGIAAPVSVTGVLALESSSGTVAQTGGSIIAPTIVSSGTIGGDASLASATNAIGTLGGFTVATGHTLDFADSVSLTVAGPVISPFATIAAPTLSITGSIGGTSEVALLADSMTISTGSVTVPNGTIAIAPLDPATTTVISFGSLSTDSHTLGLRGSLVNRLDAGTLIIGSAGGLTVPTIISEGGFNYAGSTVAGMVILDASTLVSQIQESNPLVDNLSFNTIAINAPTVSLAATINAPDLLELGSTGTISQTGGSIQTGSLVSIGKIGGDVSLTGALNSITSIGSFAASGNITLDNSIALGIAGTVSTPGTFALANTGNVTETSGGTLSVGTFSGTSGGTIALTNENAIGTISNLSAANAITLNNGPSLLIGGFVHTGTLALEGGGVTEVTGGSITATTLVTTGTNVTGDVLLTNGNSIGTLGGFIDSGNLFLNDTIGLGVAGPATLTSATLSATAISITGSISTSSELSLESGSSITETGSITAGTLDTGGTSIPDDVTLTGANAIGTLGGFTLAGSLQLNDTIGLAIAGLVTTANGITLSGTSLTETGAGAIHAGSLTTGSGSFTGNVVLGGANSIVTLGGFTAGGTFNLANIGSLDIAGSVAGSNVSLSAPTISLGADVHATAALNPLIAVAADSITSTGGMLLAALGTIELGPYTNHGTIDLSGTYAYFDSTASEVLIGSALGSQAAAISITTPATIGGTLLVLSANTIAAANTLDATGNTLALLADTITSTGGTFLANQKTIEIAPFSFTTIDLGGNDGNALDLSSAVLAALDTTAAEILIGRALATQVGSINIDGSVGIGGTYAVLSAANGITDTGTFAAGPVGDNTLAFDGGGFVQTGNTAEIMAGMLESDGAAITGPVSLASTLNNIQTLGLISLSSSNLALTDGIPLTVTGPVSAKNITLADTNSTGIIIDGTLAAASNGTITLVSDALSATGGTLTGGEAILAPWTSTNTINLGGTSVDNLDLNQALVSIIGTGILQIGTGGGAIIQENSISIATPTLAVLSGTFISLAGTLDVPATLSLASTGDISQSGGGTLDVGTLTGTAAGIIALLGGNSIVTLSNVSAGSDITIDNATTLLIAGLVKTGGSNTIALFDGGGVTETGTGALSAGTLSGSINNNAILNGANTISIVNDLTVGNVLSFSNPGGPGGANYLGSLNAGDAYFNGDGITIDGFVDIGPTNGTLGLFSTGGITETSNGYIHAITLTGTDSGGDALLTSNLNSIATLADFTVATPNTLHINDLGSLTVAGTVAADTATISADTITIAGTISTATDLALESTGTITETSGIIIDTGTLESGGTTIGGDAWLMNGNTIGTLGGFTVAGTLALNDVSLLEIGGEAHALDKFILTGSSVTETGAGLIDTQILTTGTGSITGYASLTNGNSIDALSGFTTTGALNVTNAVTLGVGGVSAADAYLSAPGLVISGGIGAGIVGLTATSGAITETTGAGFIDATTLTGSDTGGDVTLLGSNAVDTLSNFSATDGNFRFNNDIDLAIAGLVQAGTNDTITLEGLGSITETTGTLIARNLDSGGTTIGGDVTLMNHNTIGTLGNFTVAASHALAFADTGLLTVGGTVAAPIGTLSSDSIDISGSIDIPGLLVLESPGEIYETSGTVTAGTLESGGTTIGGDVFLTNANSIDNLGNFTAALGTVALDNAINLTIAGSVSMPGTLSLQDDANITESSSGTLAVGTLTGGAAGAIALTSQNLIGTLSNLSAGSDITLNNGIILPIAGLITTSTVLALEGAGFTEVSGGAIDAPSLVSTGSDVSGSVLLDNGGNYIASIGPFTAGSIISILDQEALGASGVDAGGVFLTAPGINIGAGGITAYGVGLYSTAGITEPNGFIHAHYLTGTDSGGDVVLTGHNTITNLNSFAAPDNNFSINNDIGLTLAGALTAVNLYADGVASVTGPVSISNNATIANPRSGVTLAGPMSIGGTLLVESASTLSQAANTGYVNAGQATLISNGAIGLDGNMSITGLLDLMSYGNITHRAGSLVAATLAGSVGTITSGLAGAVASGSFGTQALFGTVTGGLTASSSNAGAVTDFNTLTSFTMNDSQFVLNNAGTLVIVGPVRADTVTINARGTLALDGMDGGGLFLKGKLESNSIQSVGTMDSLLRVTPGVGENAGQPTIVQTGTFFINQGTAQPATVFLSAATPNGSINFAQPPGAIDAPSVDLVLAVGPRGTISGNVNLQHIEILSALSTNLTGTLDNVTGQAAAGKGTASPFPQSTYRFNACPIGSVNCTILPVETLPQTNPLENFDITQRKRKRLGQNVHLPGIATRDF